MAAGHRENFGCIVSYIYALTDPRTNSIRYVGGTSTSLRQRLAAHMCDLRRSNTPKSIWIKSLLEAGTRPGIHPLEEIDGDFWGAEQDWIKCLRRCGSPLLNATDGGKGSVGWKAPESVKLKMSASAMGRKLTAEHKAKLSAANAKRIWTDESRTRNANSQRGKKVSAETRAKMSASSHHVHSPEHIANIVAGHARRRALLNKGAL